MSRKGWCGVGLCGLLAGYVFLAGNLPAADDEIYYWCWSQDLGPSYFDHPPLTAYLIRASTALFGNSLTAIRLPACVAAVATLAVLGWLTRLHPVLAWVLASPAFTFGAVLITPDAPLQLAWVCYLAWLMAVHGWLGEHPRSVPVWLWLLGGVILGCGGLSKYTMVLAVPCGFASFLFLGSAKRWLLGYLMHGLIALTMVLPVLAFNLEHDFAPLRFQWNHATIGTQASRLESLAEFAGVQVMLFGLLPFALLPWVLSHSRVLLADPRLRVAVALYALPLLIFLYKASQGPVEGNWALACFLGFWPIAAKWHDSWAVTRLRRWVMAATFAIPLGCVAILLSHLIGPLDRIPVGADRISRQEAKAGLAACAADAIRAAQTGPIYTESYQWTAWLRYHGVDARQLTGLTRPSQFTLKPNRFPDSPVVDVFTEIPFPTDLTASYGKPEVLADLPLVVRGERANRFYLLRYRRLNGE